MEPYLYAHPNPNAPRRANGVRFWGYPTRSTGIRAIGVHTAETAPSQASAENIARYLSTTDRAASYHRVVDSDTTVQLLPDEATAFGIVKFNSPTLHLSWATRAAMWGQYPVWDDQALHRGADVAAEWVQRHDIPVRWITKAQADQGDKGLVLHRTMDPARRSDPGDGFPADEFLRRVLDRLTAPPAHREPDLAVAVRYAAGSTADERIARGLAAMLNAHVADITHPATIGRAYLVGGHAVRTFDRDRAKHVVDVAGPGRDQTLDMAITVARTHIRSL